ncbi:hypothetical protein KC19_3G179700 [Ceratodon purpureus]|uniref:Secreted protein n=1 Tax=Ceratodon purpureus TaxID=3225 RepID=A0A8T0IN84_CERPU|nr:hypothetical protein KC19_3G179700 [Ceratodon purpureus]
MKLQWTSRSLSWFGKIDLFIFCFAVYCSTAQVCQTSSWIICCTCAKLNTFFGCEEMVKMQNRRSGIL